MSSCKILTDRARSNACQRDSQRRKMPPLLRLDSTGEISSAAVFNPRQKSKVTGKQNSKNQMPFKGLFDGFNMTTVLGTANSYFGTAANYLEGFCNRRSRQDLARSDSDTTFLEYIRKLNSPKSDMGKCHSGSLDSSAFGNLSFANTNNSGYPTKDEMQASKIGTTEPVSSSIFGVIQNPFVNSNCRFEKSKSEPYIPPPLKKKMMESTCNNRGVSFDPKLTPYNARLLERSKTRRFGDETAKHGCRWNPDNQPSVSSHQQNKRTMKTPPPVYHVADIAQVFVQEEPRKPNCDNEPQSERIPTSDDIPKADDSVSDWFEYENESQNVIPIHFDIECKQQKSAIPAETNSNAKSCDTKEKGPSMHSWLSVELDLDVQKATEESLQSSHENKSQHSCDKSEPVNLPQLTEEKCSKGAVNNEKTESKHVELNRDCVFPQVLYIRNIQNGRKCRPSSKKRRRQKPHPNDVDSKSTEKRSAKCPASSVAFILGLDKEDMQNHSQSFLVPCDTDSSSDWSDSDLEVDGADDTINKQFCSLSSPFSLFNLEVLCTIQQTSPPCSSLDAVNLSWQLNIAMDSDQNTKKKKENSTTKKVQFANEKDLETVHHMVAWSYAYAAARKGPWEEIARDRGRFKRRITDGDKMISPILDSKHRKNIYAERFERDS